jgi:hypothetical protein
MGYASQAGRARTDPSNPQAHAICDRCGFRYNHADLKWQFDWRGVALQNIRILVCRSCTDSPQEQSRSIVVPADPMPVMNARVEVFNKDEADFLTTSGPTVYDTFTGIPIPSSTNITTPSGTQITTQPSGPPTGYSPDAVMPLQLQAAYGVSLSILSVFSVGTPIITVTCSAAHGLAANAQVFVEGMSAANGLYSVTPTTAMAFTFQANKAVPAGSLLRSYSRIITASVGLPYDYAQVPETGA